MAAEYRLRIESDMTPDTFPMDRLAEYLGALAKLLGKSKSVHFADIESGSAIVVARIDDDARASVVDRIRGLPAGFGPKDALKAYSDIDEMLRRDGATGCLLSEEYGIVIPFPGRERPEPIVFGPFKQDGTLDGQVIRVGGSDDTVPVHLRDTDTIHTHLHATPEIARRIAQHLLGPVVRVHGTGTWFRGEDGIWELKSFKITDFELLGDEPLTEVVRNIRKIGGSQWNEVPDPVRFLIEQRRDDGEFQ
ncbi:hypothetical protein LJR220_006915 [Bradyrhizobium sp. LjRoot220]|uniref:hypothetical protein n=1 Tax=Bradyrhizobium sp. LjRoot220 TaxID=3342284 RepID=UPI003ECD286B